MAYSCDMCNKGTLIGKTHRHHPGVAGQRWKQRAPKHSKTFRPNLHAAHILLDGTTRRLRLCTKCLRRAKEAMQTKPQGDVMREAAPATATA